VRHLFDAPDKVMVGTRGEVGSRLFLIQARQGRRLIVVKAEKVQLAALADWLAGASLELGRPGHLPEDLDLEPEYEPDLVAGEIAVALDEEARRLEVTITSAEEDDEVELHLSAEWAGALAIAITRLVEAGRPLCPLCGGPLDPRGHDCPRTNGHRAPVR
jgi:uncharacterized repeat protein (TIGR03847 family)